MKRLLAAASLLAAALVAASATAAPPQPQAKAWLVQNAETGEVIASSAANEHRAIASINSPMQCMMKEICAQCLQRHVDPETGKEEFIFSCYNQDQELDRVDFNNLHARLRQNTVQEKLSNLWFEHLLDQADSELVHV